MNFELTSLKMKFRVCETKFIVGRPRIYLNILRERDLSPPSNEEHPYYTMYDSIYYHGSF